jgi:hypothetical protein
VFWCSGLLLSPVHLLVKMSNSGSPLVKMSDSASPLPSANDDGSSKVQTGGTLAFVFVQCPSALLALTRSLRLYYMPRE